MHQMPALALVLVPQPALWPCHCYQWEPLEKLLRVPLLRNARSSACCQPWAWEGRRVEVEQVTRRRQPLVWQQRPGMVVCEVCEEGVWWTPQASTEASRCSQQARIPTIRGQTTHAPPTTTPRHSCPPPPPRRPPARSAGADQDLRRSRTRPCRVGAPAPCLPRQRQTHHRHCPHHHWHPRSRYRCCHRHPRWVCHVWPRQRQRQQSGVPHECVLCVPTTRHEECGQLSWRRRGLPWLH